MPAGAPWRSALARGVLFVTSDRAFLEQVLAQVLVGLGVAAAQPLQGHRRLLQLRADDCEYEQLRKILRHNPREELGHAAMALEWLRRSDPETDENLRADG